MVEFTVKDLTIKAATKPDLFSPKSLDQGTRLLLELIASKKYSRVLDWGCGWGAIALFAAKNSPDAKVTAIDSDIAAVQMTSENSSLNLLDNIEVVASHGFDALEGSVKFDLILSNPPTHRGREVVEAMVRQAHDRLEVDGELAVVVESRISPWLKRTMASVFGNYKILKRGPKNVVLVSQKRSVDTNQA